jgi:hypothetical protein
MQVLHINLERLQSVYVLFLSLFTSVSQNSALQKARISGGFSKNQQSVKHIGPAQSTVAVASA